MAKHTPGPWLMKRIDKNHACIYDADGMCVVFNAIAEPHSPTEANARLIAAAPELLAACLLWLADEYADNEPGYRDRARAAGRAAIAKATS
jgi:hypothetical protein